MSAARHGAPGNPLGLHALVWVGDWSPASAAHAISSTAELGFDLIEVPLLDPGTGAYTDLTLPTTSPV